MNLRERLLSKAIINWETGCWEWTAYLNHGGYGRFGISSARRVSAHRFSYELLVGPIPEGLTLDHLCRNRACINPAHLEPVTSRENTLRAATSQAYLNSTKTHCKYGHEFTLANTYHHRGTRACRACNRDANRRYKARKKETAP